MKINLIGTGKTGSKVKQLLIADQIAGEYNSRHQPTVTDLRCADCSIIFVPAAGAHELYPLVLESGTPAIWATTGVTWTEQIRQAVRYSGNTWIVGVNFSLGMNLVQQCIKILANSNKFIDQPYFSIRECHHKDKIDVSGTALHWQTILERDLDIESQREGDHVGTHELVISSGLESITLKHEAHDRLLFAKGAVWAARYLLDHPDMEPGIHEFNTIIERFYRHSNC